VNLALRDWKKNIFIFLFYCVVAASLLAPIGVENYIPNVADYTNHIASIIQAKMALMEGQFPIRVSPFENQGLRYPIFQFYSPSTYTIAGLLYQWITPANPLLACKFTMWIALIIGGVYMNRLIYWFVHSKPAALLGSLVYLSSPYYIIVINGFGDLSEAVALGLLPVAVFYTLKHYFHLYKLITLLQMSMAWYFLITTHLITFFYTFIFINIFLLLITLKNKKHIKNLIRAGIGYFFAFLLAAWYLAPVSYLGKYLLINVTMSNTSTFMHFKPVFSQLVYQGGSTFRAQLIYNHPAIGWTILLAAGASLYAVINKFSIQNKRGDYLLPYFLVVFILVFLLTWSPINFWQWLPHILLLGQYSWRLLSQVIWIGALLFAWSICWVFQNKIDRRHIIIGILLIGIATSSWFPTLENSFKDLPKLVEKPSLVYNENAYLINFNKNTQFVNKLDTIKIYLLMFNNILATNLNYTIPETMLKNSYQPYVTVDGSIENLSSKNQQITALINSTIITTVKLKQGKYHWEIPLMPTIHTLKKSDKYEFQFKLTSSNPQSDLKIHVDNILLSGFLNPEDTLKPEQIKSLCRQDKTTTICEIDVPQNINLIELPALYYPKLLEITLNEKPISYVSVLNDDLLFASIKPEPGKINLIKIKFLGLEWANVVSMVFLSLWIGLLILSFFIPNSRRQPNRCSYFVI